MARVELEKIYFCEVKECNNKIEKDEKYCWYHRDTDCRHNFEKSMEISTELPNIEEYEYNEELQDKDINICIKNVLMCCYCKKIKWLEELSIDLEELIRYFNDNKNELIDIYKKIQLENSSIDCEKYGITKEEYVGKILKRFDMEDK